MGLRVHVRDIRVAAMLDWCLRWLDESFALQSCKASVMILCLGLTTYAHSVAVLQVVRRSFDRLVQCTTPYQLQAALCIQKHTTYQSKANKPSDNGEKALHLGVMSQSETQS